MAKTTATEELIEAIARGTEQVLETLADIFSGNRHTLRDGTEFCPVMLPRDLAAHSNVQTEWWYYTGHLKSASGRRYGFELVFFKRRTDQDRFGPVPLRLLGNPYYFAHFAISDLESGTFRYSHKKSCNGPLDEEAEAAEDHYFLRFGTWAIFQAGDAHTMRAEMEDGTRLDIAMTPRKPVVLNGKSGVSFKDEGQASRYFSYTRMEIAGSLLVNGRREEVRGTGWMDREFGTWQPTENQKGWDWFSIQLEDNTELMCYQLRNSRGDISPYSCGTFVNQTGQAIHLENSQFKIEPIGVWRSSSTGAEYPSNWIVTVPSIELTLRITPLIEDQELDTRGTTMIVYWEGACDVTGNVRGNQVAGRAYVELVGYDRSHERPNLAYFLLGRPNELLRKVGLK
ncbi:MAG: carotenoid 1,2-hydratase [Blastocatellia bacterium]